MKLFAKLIQKYDGHFFSNFGRDTFARTQGKITVVLIRLQEYLLQCCRPEWQNVPENGLVPQWESKEQGIPG